MGEGRDSGSDGSRPPEPSNAGESKAARKKRYEAAKAERKAKYEVAKIARKEKYEATKTMRKAFQMPRMHGVDAIRSPKLHRVLGQHLGPYDAVEAVVVGRGAQAIIALHNRLLVAKAGSMAGATGGGRVTEFRYRDILGIQVDTGISNATIVVQTGGVNTTPGGYWAVHGLGHAAHSDDPFKLPNVIPSSKQLLRLYAPDLEHIRERVRRAGEPLEVTVQLDDRRPCEWCAEMIKPQAKVCRFCGRDVNRPIAESPAHDDLDDLFTLRCETCGSEYIAGTVLCADCMGTDLRPIEAP